MMRHYFIPIRIPYIKNSDNIKCYKDVGKWNQSYTAQGNVKWYSLSGNSVLVSHKIKHPLTI